MSSISSTHFCETNRSRFFTEALTAKIETVLANEASLMRAQAAVARGCQCEILDAFSVRTIAYYPFHICVGERTKLRRVSLLVLTQVY